MKNKIIIFSIIIFALIIYFFTNVVKKEDIIEAQASGVIIDNDDKDKEVNTTVENNITDEKNIVTVDIKGAVKNPGVYEIENNKRVIDVIELSGGTTKDANTNYVNLSTRVSDEMVIWIYTNKDIEELNLKQSSVEYMVKECNCPIVDNTTCLNSKEEKNVSENTEGLININTASESDLMSLSGIGESKAKSIIDYRNKNGKFKSTQDIMNVSGIGESLYNKIKEHIEV